MIPTQPNSKAPKTWRLRITEVLFIAVFLWLLALIALGCVPMDAGNPSDLRWATHVTDATAEHTDGLTENNADALASTFEQAPYEVRVHESAIDVDGGIRYAKELKIHSYRPAPKIAD